MPFAFLEYLVSPVFKLIYAQWIADTVCFRFDSDTST